MKSKQRMHYFRLCLGILWATVALGGLLFLTIFIAQHGLETAHAELRNFLLENSRWKEELFLLLFSIRIFFFIPSVAFILVAGAIFPPVPALLLSVAGETISSVLLYLLVQFLGKNFIQSHESRFFKKIDHALEKRGFFATLVLVIIPFVPLDSIAIVAGLSRIAFRDFFWGIFIGIIGTTIPYLFLGSSLGQRKSILFAILGFFLIFLITLWAWKHPHFRHFFPKKKK